MIELLLLMLASDAQQRVTLTTPLYQSAGVPEIRPGTLILQRALPDTPAYIRAIFYESTAAGFTAGGRSVTCYYEGATASTMIGNLNTANLSVKSLEQRVVEQCQTDKQIPAGAIVGTPQ